MNSLHDKEGCTTPVVSWLICSNRLDDKLFTAVQSCIEQTYTNFEILLIANGPLAAEIAKALQPISEIDPRIRVITTDIRYLNFSLNLGLHHARGELVARMDADDVSYPCRLELQVQYMRAHPDVTVLGSAFAIIEENGTKIREIHPPQDHQAIRDALLYKNPLCHPSVMFRRSAIVEIGGYMGGVHAEDYDLWARLAMSSKAKFANIDKICIGYRAVPTGNARYSRLGYANVAAAQLRNCVAGGGVKWGVASLLSICKSLLRSKPIEYK